MVTLLDTDIFSEVLKGIDQRVTTRARAYRNMHGVLMISVMSVTEIVKGYRRGGRYDRLALFLASLDGVFNFPFDRETAILAGRIQGDLERAGTPIGPIDPLIAATAVQHGLTLATGNMRRFARVAAVDYQLPLDDWRA